MKEELRRRAKGLISHFYDPKVFRRIYKFEVLIYADIPIPDLTVLFLFFFLSSSFYILTLFLSGS